MGYRMLKHMAIDPIQLTRQLVNIESTTYREGLAGAFLHEYLTAQKYDVERMPVAQPDKARTPGADTGERFNVYAALPGVTPDVVLSTHMDTVPPFFGCTEDDEFLYGRGTCDAKGIIAAQVAAADRLRDTGVKVGLLFVVGEERDSAGAIVANLSPKGSKFLINGEPTDNRLALASKGALRVELRAKGRMAHSAYPELGDSAINKLVEALHDVLAMPLPSEPEIGSSTLNIGLISGGYAPNVISDKAEAHILIRLVGPSDETKRSILAVVGDRADVVFSLDLPFVRMRKAGNLPTMIAKFTTDIPALTAWGEPFLLGPGSIHVAHTPDEKIAKKELLECVDLYVNLAMNLTQGS
jgi:acetylornithine deacetylase